ncbi:MAG: rod shape-determining protein MreD [Brevinematia bacterium]
MKNQFLFYLKYAVIIIIFVALQASNVLAIFDISPDIILIVVILHTLYFGDYPGMFFGFFMGLFIDSMSGTLLGTNAFVFTFLSSFLGLYRKYIFVSDLFSFVIFIIIATIIKYALYSILYLIFEIELFNFYLLIKLAGEIFYNSFVSLPLFFLMPFIYRRKNILY